MEFDCILRVVTTAEDDNSEYIDACLHYFDPDEGLNIVMKGKYKPEVLDRIKESLHNKERIKIRLQVKE